MKIPKLDIKNKHFVMAFVVIGGFCFLYSIKESTREAPPAMEEPGSVDTFIPVGYKLVTVEIANAESLDSLIGKVGGVVDLYLPADDKRKHVVKVASRLKLLRAPLNPQTFAVLLRQHDESSNLIALKGPFIAVVQNPEAKGMELNSETKSKSIRIEYQN